MRPFMPLMLLFAAMTSAPKTQARDAGGTAMQANSLPALRQPQPQSPFEVQAAQQYLGLKQHASRYDALAGDDHPQLRRLRTIAGRLIMHAARWNPRAPQWQWEVNLIGSREMSAFCLPGGKILFYSGMLGRLHMTDDEIAVVMGHEMAHALREHGREQAARSEAASVGARLAGLGLAAWLGVDARVAAAATGGLANLGMLKFSRADETEADRIGLDLAARAGFDPRAGISLWQKMARGGQGGGPQWLSSHPAGAARMAELRSHLPAVMPLYARARAAGGEASSAHPGAGSNLREIATAA